MNVYVFDYIGRLTDRWHPEGGLVIVAQDEDRARELIEQDRETIVDDEEWREVVVYPTSDDAEERVYKFPDAGCC